MERILFSLLWGFSIVVVGSGERSEKMFSLFNVVKFRNTECTSTQTNGLQGVCFTAQECTDLGGNAQGNCAASFGVCCILSTSTCGTTSSSNVTHLESTGFPAAHTGNAGCVFTIQRCSSDICQVRLDFIVTSMQQPDTLTGLCVETLDIVPGQTGQTFSSNPPQLCGVLSTQHMYLDAGSAQSIATITFGLATPTMAFWRIKTSQIECSAAWRAPQGCLQYFMGPTGTVQSFNWDGTCPGDNTACATGIFLINQNHAICFRHESGMCAINIAESIVGAAMDAFSLGQGDLPLANALCLESTCIPMAALNGSYITIRDESPDCLTMAECDLVNAYDCADQFCGTNLAYGNGANLAMRLTTVPGTITSEVTPFIMRVFTAGNQINLGGFSLDYSQSPCGVPQ